MAARCRYFVVVCIFVQSQDHKEMPSATGGLGVTGVATTLLFGGSLWGSDTPTPSPYNAVEISPHGSMFTVWDEESDAVDCKFWNGTFYYSPSTCDPFAVSRISPSMASSAIARAVKCGAQFDTHCVLSGEIGFSAPAAFVYDLSEGFRMILAPRLSPVEGSVEKMVRLQDPSAVSANAIMRFNSSVEVEYLSGGSRVVHSETLEGEDAFCVQTLRASILPACWIDLD